MKLILTSDVKGLGKKGDLVDVAEGYGRNFLLPRQLAVPATTGQVRELQQRQERVQEKKDRQLREAQALAGRLKGLEVKIPVRTGEGGKLFGAVTTREIAEVLEKDHALQVDRKQIEIKETIKTLGEHPATVRLYPGVTAGVTVQVVAI